MTDCTPLVCPQCAAISWYPEGHLAGSAADLFYVWCSPCSAREQDEFLAMLMMGSPQIGEAQGRAEANPRRPVSPRPRDPSPRRWMPPQDGFLAAAVPEVSR